VRSITPDSFAYIDTVRWCPYRLLVWGIVVAAAALSALPGCSSHGGKTAAHTGPPPGAIGVSPAGVTTRVDVPAKSTEGEYDRACLAAKTWMNDRHGDPQSLIEPYLATIQATGPGGAGTWNTPWSKLTPARQAAVIAAVHAAADDLCG
jgi:Putative lipoprotein LpqV